MGLIRTIFRAATRPVRAKMHGVQGERRVNSQLNPILFDKVEHRQINNLIILDDNGKSHQIDHIEIRENGIFCIETKNYIGWVYGDETSDKWTQTLYTGEKHKLLNPLKQNRSHCYHLSRILGPKYHINSLVVMANNNADKVNSDQVINVNNLRHYLKTYNDGSSLYIEEMDKIYNTLMSASSGMTNREHVQNIRQTQIELRNNICPRCGGALVLRNGSNGKFYGCSNYPKCKFTKKY